MPMRGKLREFCTVVYDEDVIHIHECTQANKECGTMASVLHGFEEVNLVRRMPEVTMTVTESVVRFNKGTAEALGWPAYVRVLVNDRKKQVAVQVCDKDDPNAVRFSKTADKQIASVSIHQPMVLVAVQKYLPLEQNVPEGEVAYQTVKGEVFANDHVAVFDTANAVSGVMKKRGRKKGSVAAAQAE